MIRESDELSVYMKTLKKNSGDIGYSFCVHLFNSALRLSLVETLFFFSNTLDFDKPASLSEIELALHTILHGSKPSFQLTY